MLKKILTTVLFVVLAAGAVYCWQKVDFNRKTAMFFQVVFGGENSMGGPGGRPPMGGDNRGAGMTRPDFQGGQESGRDSQETAAGSSQMAEAGERGAAPPDFARGGNPEAGNSGGGPPGGGHGGPGGYVSLGEVAKYTVIMAFVTMLTVLLDRGIRTISRSRKASAA